MPLASVLPAFTWRLLITWIAGMVTARRSAATKTKICKRTVKPRPAGEARDGQFPVTSGTGRKVRR